MKKKIWTLYFLMIICGCLQWTTVAFAQRWEFQPRVEAGMVLYSMKIDAQSTTVPTSVDELSGYNTAKQEIEFSDNMRFVGCGTTLFLNRLFVDLSLQRAFDGNDDAQVSLSEFDEDIGDGTSAFTSADYNYRGHFDRMEWAVSMGYAVTPQFSIFVGYKWAETDMETAINGGFSLLSINNWVGHGRLTGDEILKFKYEGPFIGAAHGWPVDHLSFLRGMISVNLGIASLQSTFSQDRTTLWSIHTLNGIDLPSPVDFTTEDRNDDIGGDALGVTLGLGWHGKTWLDDLSYTLALSGYRYQFNSDDSNYSDISETAMTIKVGVAYAF